jgi:hypothetical protein
MCYNSIHRNTKEVIIMSNTKSSFLPSASEMREMMKTTLSEKDESQLKEIAVLIKRRFYDGYCYYCNTVSALVKKELESAGYAITEYNDQRDGYSMTISWK